jgi:hypothetical protein
MIYVTYGTVQGWERAIRCRRVGQRNGPGAWMHGLAGGRDETKEGQQGHAALAVRYLELDSKARLSEAWIGLCVGSGNEALELMKAGTLQSTPEARYLESPQAQMGQSCQAEGRRGLVGQVTCGLARARREAGGRARS